MSRGIYLILLALLWPLFGVSEALPSCHARRNRGAIARSGKTRVARRDEVAHTGGQRSVPAVCLESGYRPGISSRGDWDAGAIAAACVSKVDGVYHLYYRAWGDLSDKGKKEEYDTLQIGHAVSLDGVHWVKDPANPVIRKAAARRMGHARHLGPVHDSRRWQFQALVRRGARATSVIGATPNRTMAHISSNMVRSVNSAASKTSALFTTPESHEYRLYYWDRDKAPWDEVMKGPPAPSGLSVATSKNETDFDFAHAQRLTIAGQAWPGKYSHVLRADDKWAMFFGEAVVRGKPSRTGLAFSNDGSLEDGSLPARRRSRCGGGGSCARSVVDVLRAERVFRHAAVRLATRKYEGPLEQLSGRPD